MQTRTRGLVPALTFLFLIAVNGSCLAANGSDNHWVTTWAAAPSTLPPAGHDDEVVYENLTLRQVVHTSAGGAQLRIRLSNVHGSKALRVGAITVALQKDGDQVIEETLRHLTFSRQKAVTIPRGAVVLSDPVDFDLPPKRNLAISIYLSEASSVTRHRNANQTNWLSVDGNHVNAIDFPESATISSWDFLNGVEVLGSQQGRSIAAVGDSITDGYLSTIDTNRRWPDQLSSRLQAAPDLRHFAVVNLGISGNRVLREDNPNFGENLLARLDRDVFAVNGLSHIILLEGINDIGMGSRDPDAMPSAEDLIAGYRQVIARASSRGIAVIGGTLLPFEGAAYYSEAGEALRQQVNHWIRTSGEFDGVVDFDSATRDKDNPRRLRAEFTEDMLHPNDAGYKAMAEAIDLNLFREQ